MEQRLTHLAPHETLELQEILRSETTAVTKLQASLAMVRDADLKTYMQNLLDLKQDAVRQYQDFYRVIVHQ